MANKCEGGLVLVWVYKQGELRLQQGVRIQVIGRKGRDKEAGKERDKCT